MSKKPIRVLHVLGRMNPGGLETSLLHVLRYLERARFQFDFCTLGGERGTYDSEIEVLGGRIIPCRLGRNPVSFARRFRHILRKGGYDIVHSHVHDFSGAILRLAHTEGVPIRIAHSRNTNDGKRVTLLRPVYKRLMKSWIHRYATYGLAVSEVAGAALFGRAWESDERFRVLYSGTDMAEFEKPVDREEVRRELEIRAEVPVIGHVGRFYPQKNHRFLLQVGAAFLKIRPEAHLLLVGDGPLRRETEAQARELGLSKHVHFLGIRDDIARLMRGAMDAFLLPSLHEGLPRVLVEAQAAGLRCLVSRNVTQEAAVLSDGVVFTDLSAGSHTWASQLDELLRLGRIPEENALHGIRQSPFFMEKSLDALCKIYEAA